jgi:nucleoside-diphosphate-sugar epimerase
MILLTGANGHLGANLLRRLIADCTPVRVLLRRQSNNSTVDGLDVERVFGDLREPASLIAATRGVEGIYHCAALVSTVYGNEQEIFVNNVLGTRNLLRAALQNDVRRVVVSSSLSAVGHRETGPTDETEPFNPFERHLPYAVSKAAVEHECLKAKAAGLDVVIAISCAILGPYDFKPSRMGQVLINYANGRLRAYIPGGFEFVAARDIAEGHVLALQKGRAGDRYIFSSEFMTLDMLFDLYREITGRPKPVRLPSALMMAVAEVSDFVHRHFLPGRRQLLTPAAVHLLRTSRRVDISKAKRELGYRPTSIAGAAREAYLWFVARGAIDSPRLNSSPTGTGRRTTVDTSRNEA